MCGIAGAFRFKQLEPSQLEQTLARLSRRGPDSYGKVTWNRQWENSLSNGPVSHALLHTRLSIRDTRDLASQPMQWPERKIWICYNGEVYGWEKEREKLEAKGYAFRSNSDTEYILASYVAYGFDATLAKLRGMFALAILDLEAGCLHLARDRMGEKPLLYYHKNGEFAFASLVSALLPILPRAERVISPKAIDAFLAHRYIPAPLTLFTNIRRLENGQALRLNLVSGELKHYSYWRPNAQDEGLQEALDEAVQLRTVADRPVGLFLSGGVDSAVIASSLTAQNCGNIQCFTASFPGNEKDESQEAARVAKHFGLPHHEVVIPTTIRDDFDQIVSDFDEPFADPSGFPLWYLSRVATEEVKVVLNGDGADELFAGYKRYNKHLRSAFRRNWRIPGLPRLSSSSNRGLAKILTECCLSWQEAYSLRFSGFTPNQRVFLQPDFKRSVANTYWRSEYSLKGAVPQEPIEQLLDIDRLNYLPEYVLRKADLVTMAHGLEARAPMLDHRFVETVMGLQADDRYTQPAKLALEPWLTDLGSKSPLILKKKGFNPPLELWLRDDLADRLAELGPLLDKLTGGQISAQAVIQLDQSYRQGEEALAEQLMQLLVLESSLRGLQHSISN